MIEKVIKIQDIPLVEFYGVENIHMKILAKAFPSLRLTSRGDEIYVQGSILDVRQISETIQSLMLHYKQFKVLMEEHFSYYSHKESPLENVDGSSTTSNTKLKNNSNDRAIIESRTEPRNNVNLDEDDIILHGARGMAIRAKSLNQQKLIDAVRKNDLVFAIGPAGTGKTYISVALAVRALKNKEVKKIILTRPAVEAGESLGFLPGDLKEKIDPYIRPIYDALEDMIPPDKLKLYQEQNVIEIAPLAYMRGRTLKDAFILLDEAQNTTPMQIKMFMTRMGMNSKMIITGDPTQIDLPSKQKSGLIDAVEILKNVPSISMVELDAKDVTRHKLVKDIILAYEKQST